MQVLLLHMYTHRPEVSTEFSDKLAGQSKVPFQTVQDALQVPARSCKPVHFKSLSLFPAQIPNSLHWTSIMQSPLLPALPMRSATACGNLLHISSDLAMWSISILYTSSHAIRIHKHGLVHCHAVRYNTYPIIMRRACSSVDKHGLQPPARGLLPTGNIVLVTTVLVSVGLVFLIGQRAARRLPAAGLAAGAAAAALADCAARVGAQPAGAAPPAAPPPWSPAAPALQACPNSRTTQSSPTYYTFLQILFKSAPASTWWLLYCPFLRIPCQVIGFASVHDSPLAELTLSGAVIPTVL